MVTGAASNDLDVFDPGENRVRLVAENRIEHTAITDTPFQAFGDGLSLFVNFLEHVMPVLTLARRVAVEFADPDIGLLCLAPGVINLVVMPVEHDVIAFFEVNETIGDRQQGRDVGGNEVFPDTDTHHQRAAAATGDKGFRVVDGDNAKRKGALEFVHRFFYRGEQVVVVMAVNEMRHYLGIGFRAEFVTCLEQALANALVVFDDAVVHDGDPLAGKMRVGIGFRGFAMRRPARVSDTDMAGLFLGQARLEFLYLAKRAKPFEITIMDKRHACGIVTAVLETVQTFEQDRANVALRERANYSTHVVNYPLIAFSVLTIRRW